MSDTPTREIITPKTKTKVVLKEWITGYDNQAIEAIYLNAADLTGSSADNIGAKFKGDVIAKADQESLRRVVVSVNGSSENIVNDIMSLPLIDTKFVAAEVGKVVNPLVEE